VLVCDDSAFMRKAISQLISSDPGCVVIDTARNGQEALEKAVALKPDVITLDIEMPIMNGHQALAAIRRECRDHPDGPPAVLMCSSLTSAGSHDALQALREGAADVIAKDHSTFSLNMNDMRDDLIRKIKAVGGSRSRRAAFRASLPRVDSTTPAAPGALPQKPGFALAARHAAANAAAAALMDLKAISLAQRKIEIITIGSSTGGPPILEQIISQLPPSLPCPVVIAQHMPASFTKAMSERLDGMSAVSVVHGDHGMPLHPGTVYVIPGGRHGRVRSIGPGPIRLEVSDDPKSAPFKPSVNELLASAAKQCGRNALGAVLTGIGDDGKIGGQAILTAGGIVLAQDPGTSVVYGMSRAAAEIGGLSMTPDQIAKTLASLVPSAQQGSVPAKNVA
jgi:two-component system chemotaxis response regulator CheB